MGAPRNLTGQVFGRLTVLGEAPQDVWPKNSRGHRKRSWLCRCECGTLLSYPVPTARLTRGNTRSCGCLQRDLASRSGQSARVHRKTTPRVCAQCGVPFQGTAKQRFCSAVCKEAFHGGRPPVPAECPVCGEPIAQPGTGRSRLYCSESCRHRHGHRVAQREQDGTLGEQVAAIEAAIRKRDADE